MLMGFKSSRCSTVQAAATDANFLQKFHQGERQRVVPKVVIKIKYTWRHSHGTGLKGGRRGRGRRKSTHKYVCMLM